MFAANPAAGAPRTHNRVGGVYGGGLCMAGAMMGSVFLSDDDMAKLTGRKRRAAQVAALKAMAVPFRVNAAGWPVVPVSAVDGIFRQPEKVKTGWQSDKVID
jgi:hypothetical protein